MSAEADVSIGRCVRSRLQRAEALAISIVGIALHTRAGKICFSGGYTTE